LYVFRVVTEPFVCVRVAISQGGIDAQKFCLCLGYVCVRVVCVRVPGLFGIYGLESNFSV
jgi:hypothetical protein